MNEVAISLRVSTDDQEYGLLAQEDVCRAFATRMGWKVIGVFKDEDVSGSLGLEHRPGMMEAIASLGKGDVLLVAKRDRIGRLEPMAMAMIEAAVRRRGSRIVSAAGEGTENDDPANVLMRRMIDAFAEYERLIIIARTKAALKAKRTRAEKTGGSIPYGWMLGEGRPGPKGKTVKTLVPNPSEQEVIALILELRSAGLTLEAIALELRARGIQRREGATWDHGFICRLLKKAAA
jgi:DNA invertase Pin-like site-specific DNA recombinase